jgi:(R,R)-butanediol dehydrogenase/meso-butanediol dehydrogenase/diacetyl reductase
MKAVVWHAQRDMRMEDIPEPAVGPEDVKIRVKYAGICHTDVFEYLYGPFSIRPSSSGTSYPASWRRWAAA